MSTRPPAPPNPNPALAPPPLLRRRRRSPSPAAPSSTGTIPPPPPALNTCTTTSSRLDTYNIPPQFLYGGGSSSSSSTRSPDGVLASNYSLKSELEKIRLEDHYFLRPSSTAAADADATLEPDEYPDPENINLSSLMSRMRQIRSSGQIQYRIPKKRRRADEPKPRAEGELEDDELETVTIQRQKRVKKNPRGPRGEKEKERGKEKEKERGKEKEREREREREEEGQGVEEEGEGGVVEASVSSTHGAGDDTGVPSAHGCPSFNQSAGFFAIGSGDYSICPTVLVFGFFCYFDLAFIFF
ncbi:uncharacterized protein LAJ45_05030 [Morchella importuna]|uniref:uncharacterized protein n=1 Tax=Morchella importuna TaxID=1174673 RepID=UPI001E8CECD7|nr:uncharacterized protein LAJ45_05030 [Morchella importuna]KAH8150849.1 hypothetical protein LAJ45_05030 [Morchella importuna]